MSKAQTLAELEGYEEPLDMMLDGGGFDSVTTGICTNNGCDHTARVELDCADGYCEVCHTNTVSSLHRMMGVI